VAAHLETDVLILDEVLAVGMLNFKRSVWEKMEEVGKGEQYYSEVIVWQAISSQAFLIKNGTIVDSGQTQRLLKHISQLIKVGVWTSPTQTRGSKEITARILNSSGEHSSVVSFQEMYFFEAYYKVNLNLRGL